MGVSLIAVLSLLFVVCLQLTGAAVLHDCRLANETWSFKSLNCLCDKVLHIRSAAVGYGEPISTKPRKCPQMEENCNRTITDHPAIAKCQGKSKCWIPRDIVYYRPSDKLCDGRHNGNAIRIRYDCVNSDSTSTTAASVDFDTLSLTTGQFAGIIVCIVLLVLLLAASIIVVICLWRRLVSIKVSYAGNSPVESAPNTYEMSRGENSQHEYSTVDIHSEASAPVPSASNAKIDRTQPSTPPNRISHDDLTLIDNDLYE